LYKILIITRDGQNPRITVLEYDDMAYANMALIKLQGEYGVYNKHDIVKLY